MDISAKRFQHRDLFSVSVRLTCTNVHLNMHCDNCQNAYSNYHKYILICHVTVHFEAKKRAYAPISYFSFCKDMTSPVLRIFFKTKTGIYMHYFRPILHPCIRLWTWLTPWQSLTLWPPSKPRSSLVYPTLLFIIRTPNVEYVSNMYLS